MVCWLAYFLGEVLVKAIMRSSIPSFPVSFFNLFSLLCN